MKNKKIFIGWNGNDNKEIAHLVRDKLNQQGYLPIIGGSDRTAFTVNETIMRQMEACEFAIFLIEKEEKKDAHGKTISLGINPNVMMELGYMLRRISDSNRVRRILINMSPNELPSDLLGAWSETIEKRSYSNEEERIEIFEEVAQKIAQDFFEYVNSSFTSSDKLDYIDNWEENMHLIAGFDGNIRIVDKLIFGMQSTIYTGDYEKLYKILDNKKDKINDIIKEDQRPERLKFCNEHLAVIKCAMAILNVFVVTKRLTQSLNENKFDMLCEELEMGYENDIEDTDLRAWCEIFQMDKLELCYEMFADNLSGTRKKTYLYRALELCDHVINAINAQIEKNANDEKYAWFYRALAERNVSQIHKKLVQIEPDKAEEHLAKQKEYCLKTLQDRNKLYDCCKKGRRENSITMEYVSQEYLLALVEQYEFSEGIIEKDKIARTIRNIYNSWKEKNKIRNMIFDKVTKEAAGLLDITGGVEDF